MGRYESCYYNQNWKQISIKLITRSWFNIKRLNLISTSQVNQIIALNNAEKVETQSKSKQNKPW